VSLNILQGRCEAKLRLVKIKAVEHDIMETSGEGGQCTDPKLSATEQKECASSSFLLS
jgi:hypothetical protein